MKQVPYCRHTNTKCRPTKICCPDDLHPGFMHPCYKYCWWMKSMRMRTGFVGHRRRNSVGSRYRTAARSSKFLSQHSDYKTISDYASWSHLRGHNYRRYARKWWLMYKTGKTLHWTGETWLGNETPVCVRTYGAEASVRGRFFWASLDVPQFQDISLATVTPFLRSSYSRASSSHLIHTQ